MDRPAASWARLGPVSPAQIPAGAGYDEAAPTLPEQDGGRGRVPEGRVVCVAGLHAEVGALVRREAADGDGPV